MFVCICISLVVIFLKRFLCVYISRVCLCVYLISVLNVVFNKFSFISRFFRINFEWLNDGHIEAIDWLRRLTHHKIATIAVFLLRSKNHLILLPLEKNWNLKRCSKEDLYVLWKIQSFHDWLIRWFSLWLFAYLMIKINGC